MKLSNITPIFYENKEIDLSFLVVFNKLKEKWPEFLKSNKVSASIERWVGLNGKLKERNLDYERFAIPFNKAFFLKNLYKYITAISYLKNKYPIINLPLIDVGCGAGTFSIAWRYLINNDDIPIILIDRSKSQLNLAKKITHLLGLDKLHLYNASFPDNLTEKISQLSMRLFGYWFCEQNNFQKILNRENIYNLIGAEGIIVDYPDTINKINRYFKGNYHINEFILRKEANISCEILNDKNINVCGIYFIIKPLKIISDYFQMWKTHDIKAVSKIFDNNAKYHILAKNRILLGRDEIIKYWIRNKHRQNNLQISWNILSLDNDTVKVTFHAEFYDSEDTEYQRIIGTIIFTIKNSKISSLIEDYKKEVIKKT